LTLRATRAVTVALLRSLPLLLADTLAALLQQ
jgi:hypothetical protein